MADYKKIKAEPTTLTRDLKTLEKNDLTIYEASVILAKRANQIALELKEELNQKLEEYVSHNDNLEEVFENREQIEISRFYEHLPKPVSFAIQEYMEDKIYYRRPQEDNIELS
ncbi:MAG: DNA-directed RNA polymerase subunit omega [Bacteroidetes bacterium]|nr:DNA-directed RNA polymerase subunit omega [Bacteroidota bacterium]MBU1719573.1 DNA-directed RNA polymerase subunit omega [Bacteroidota bacterium]